MRGSLSPKHALPFATPCNKKNTRCSHVLFGTSLLVLIYLCKLNLPGHQVVVVYWFPSASDIMLFRTGGQKLTSPTRRKFSIILNLKFTITHKGRKVSDVQPEEAGSKEAA
jgi:hypothetical protein